MLLAGASLLIQLGSLMSEQVNWLPAIGFYLLYIVGILILAVLPAVEKESWTKALGLGCMLGLIAYATYDLSNFATLKDWPVLVVIVDIIWGTVLTGSVALISYLIAQAVK